jgi:hypothetical protein
MLQFRTLVSAKSCDFNANCQILRNSNDEIDTSVHGPIFARCTIQRFMPGRLYIISNNTIAYHDGSILYSNDKLHSISDTFKLFSVKLATMSELTHAINNYLIKFIDDHTFVFPDSWVRAHTWTRKKMTISQFILGWIRNNPITIELDWNSEDFLHFDVRLLTDTIPISKSSDELIHLSRYILYNLSFTKSGTDTLFNRTRYITINRNSLGCHTMIKYDDNQDEIYITHDSNGLYDALVYSSLITAKLRDHPIPLSN